MAASSENEEFEFRLRAEKEAAAPKLLADQIPGEPGVYHPDAPESLVDKAVGVGEAGLAGLSGMVAGPGGVAAGIGAKMSPGNVGTTEGTGRAVDAGTEFARAYTYEPRTQAGKRYTQQAAEVAGMLPPVMGTPAASLGALPVGQGVRRAAGAVGRAAERGGDAIAGGDVRNTVAERAGLSKPPDMAGVGAAATDKGRMVMERAASMPVPLKPTKAAVTFGPEKFEQTQFERETAKTPAGKALLERGAENNEALIKNFDVWMDQTGAEAPDLRATGQAVDRALVSKMNRAKGQYQAAYQAAEKSGEMRAPVSTEPLVRFVNENRSAARLAPIITAAEDEMIRLGGATRGPNGELVPGVMRLNDTETTRKLLVRLSKADETNGHYGALANEVIDQMTEGKGGEKYRAARAMFKRYANEFKNTGVVKKLVSTKPGTNDRAVALEDVFQHSILSGSLDDVRAMRKTLQTEGELGTQAWKELQGQTVNYLKEQAIGGAGRDIRGNPIVSFSKLDKAVTNLEKDGKLDFIFGKQGAQQVRDLRDLAADVTTAPPGSVNHSNSIAALKQAMGALMHAHLPTAAIKVAGAAKDAWEGYKDRKRVDEALNPQGAAERAGIAGQPPAVFRSNRRPAP